MFRSKMTSGIAGGLALALAMVPSLALAADMPAVGSKAPNFSLPAQDGKPVSLADYKGKWVVLYFYPKDQTQGCTIEAHNFQRDQDKYKAMNAVVLGVSLDTVESHATWCTKDGMSFKMLADPAHKVVDLYGVPVMMRGETGYAQRDTFLIAPDGKIAKTWKVQDVQTHSDEVLAAIKAGK